MNNQDVTLIMCVGTLVLRGGCETEIENDVLLLNKCLELTNFAKGILRESERRGSVVGRDGKLHEMIEFSFPSMLVLSISLVLLNGKRISAYHILYFTS